MAAPTRLIQRPPVAAGVPSLQRLALERAAAAHLSLDEALHGTDTDVALVARMLLGPDMEVRVSVGPDHEEVYAIDDGVITKFDATREHGPRATREMRESWRVNGKLRRLVIWEHGHKIYDGWRDQDMRLHRRDGPAFRSWDAASGLMEHEEWVIHGTHHRVGGPAFQQWTDGRKMIEQWIVNGGLHRTDAPARQEWYSDGRKRVESWHVNGKLHRVGKPAYQAWDQHGRTTSKKWYENGLLHRLDGPAVDTWDWDYAHEDTQYWRRGKRMTAREFEESD